MPMYCGNLALKWNLNAGYNNLHILHGVMFLIFHRKKIFLLCFPPLINFPSYSKVSSEDLIRNLTDGKINSAKV